MSPLASCQQGRINSSTVVFIAIITLVFVWITSGFIFPSNNDTATSSDISVPSVAIKNSQAQLVARELTLNGDIRPNQQLNIRARTDGMLEMIVDNGTEVDKGELIAKLSIDDREVQRTQAQAQVRKALSDFQATKQLIEQNLSSQSQLQALEAQLEAARAQLRRITFDIENTELTAPVSGVVNQRFIEQGAYVSAGSQVLELIDNDPLLAIINVQQSQVHRLKLGMPATVNFIGGGERQGQISFIAPIADPQTRTFRVEVTVPNQDNPIPSGMSAEVTIQTDRVKAHKISAAQIKIDTEGRMGVLTVNKDNETQFSPVSVERADVNALWVSGLDDTARVIVISHSSLTAGQKVNPKAVPAAYEGGEGS